MFEGKVESKKLQYNSASDTQTILDHSLSNRNWCWKQQIWIPEDGAWPIHTEAVQYGGY